MNKNTVTALAVAAALTFPLAAMAADNGKTAGDIMIRGRLIGVLPDVSSSVTVIGGKVDASNQVVPEVDFSYFFTDNIALELIAATNRHTIKVKNSVIGDVDVGRVTLLPPTLTAQYHFLPKSDFSPYAGAGINYTFFYNAKAAGGTVTSTSYENNFGAALQAGFDYRFAPQWYLNVDVKKLFLNTTAKVNGTAIRADVDLDPWIVGVGVGYKF